jgi:DNA-binding transcriptional regulator YiaG
MTNEFEKWRKACGLSVNEAAELLGMTRQMVYYLEHGQRAPRVDTRRLMSVIAAGQRPEPWPVESVEQK